MELYDQISYDFSKRLTRKYSTSFSLGIHMLDSKFHDSIYAIYGFVRVADEIVDTFHQHDKEKLFRRFCEDTYLALDNGISTNPILNSCLLYTSPSPRDRTRSRMPSSSWKKKKRSCNCRLLPGMRSTRADTTCLRTSLLHTMPQRIYRMISKPCYKTLMYRIKMLPLI